MVVTIMMMTMNTPTYFKLLWGQYYVSDGKLLVSSGPGSNA